MLLLLGLIIGELKLRSTHQGVTLSFCVCVAWCAYVMLGTDALDLD
jgi:hypothetical protein